MQQQDHLVYRIGDQSFDNLPKLLTFYTLHYLDTTPLRRPAPKKVELVKGIFDFLGNVSLMCFIFFQKKKCQIVITIISFAKDQDDLPFQKGEVLTVVRKDEEHWWTARNSLGQVGQIPVPYIQTVS